MKLVDLTNKVFERLVVIKRADNNKRGHTRWLCKCICGNELPILASDLTRNRMRSCGCLKKELCRAARLLPEGTAARNALYAQYRKSARERAIDFLLSNDEFVSIIDKSCHYCGDVARLKVISQARMEKKNVNGNFTYTGIDRVDSDGPYSIDNCLPCCKTCNFAKNDMGYDEFIAYLERVTTFRQGKKVAC